MSQNQNHFLNANDIAACVEVLKSRGPTYETAIRFFPKWMAERVAVLYAFVRIPDDLVNESPDMIAAADDLAQLRTQWKEAMTEPANATHPVLRASAHLFAHCEMPEAYCEAFFEAMEWDTQKNVYATMDELKEYMYGAACVVGLMMIQIMPQKGDEKATRHQAIDLGYAMQLTNFLRDIAEDYRTKKRIYIPQETMKKYGITVEDFEDEMESDAWNEMMEELIAQCRSWYESSRGGIKKMPKELRNSVGMASVLYKQYLKRIEKNKFRVWRENYRLSGLAKTRIALRTWMQKKY
jgi:phytoene synthase